MAVGKYVRVKRLILDGIDVPYSPLFSGEAEQFLKDQHSIVGMPDGDEKKAKLKELVYQFVAMGLTNAGDEKWDGDMVRNKLDRVVINQLQDLIMKESGLEVPDPQIPATS